MAKQKAIERVYGSWEGSYKELPKWLGVVCSFDQHARVEFEVVPAYHEAELVLNT